MTEVPVMCFVVRFVVESPHKPQSTNMCMCFQEKA